MKILLTGATGFIGSAFLRQALAAGHEVAALIRPEKTLPVQQLTFRGLTCLKGALDNPPWQEIAAFQPEVCVHSAWVTTPGVYLESAENFQFLDWSKAFLLRLPELGVRHVVSLGTCIEYESSNQPLSEAHSPLIPATTYARCKNELRLALENAARQGRFSLCWARVFYPYGPGEHPSRLCSSIIRSLAAGQKVVLKTPDSTKDYIFIDDLARALLTVTEVNFAGSINMGSGRGLTVREIAVTIGEILDQTKLIECSELPRHDPLEHVVADACQLFALGWHPRIGLREGIISLVEKLNK